MPSFNTIFNFLALKKPIRLIILRGLGSHNFLSDILIWKGPKSSKIYVWYSGVLTNSNLRPDSASDKKSWQKQTPIFLKRGSVFFNFLIWALLRPRIQIRWCKIFSCVIFSQFWPLQIKISDNNYWGHTLWGFLTKLVFKM